MLEERKLHMMQLQDFKVENVNLKADNIHKVESLEMTEKELRKL